MIYLYAIAESPHLTEVVGLHGALVRAIGADAPYAIASEHEELPPQPNERDLWRHERVVEGAMTGGAVLPMRFGAALADEGAVQLLLEERREEFLRLLASLSGAVELGVRARLPLDDSEGTGSGSTGESVGPGTAYLLGRRAREKRVAGAVERIHEPLSALARRSSVRAPDRARTAMKAAYLVDRDLVSAFEERVTELASELGTSIACTGPWPPYSFIAEASR